MCGIAGAITRFPINIKFVGKLDTVRNEAEKAGLIELLEKECSYNYPYFLHF